MKFRTTVETGMKGWKPTRRRAYPVGFLLCRPYRPAYGAVGTGCACQSVRGIVQSVEYIRVVQGDGYRGAVARGYFFRIGRTVAQLVE